MKELFNNAIFKTGVAIGLALGAMIMGVAHAVEAYRDAVDWIRGRI